MATSTDYLIIGAGPAGLQLGYYLDRAGRDYQILESGPTPGTFFRTFPRHRQLISINKRYTGTTDPELNLRMDWHSLLSAGDGPRFTSYTERYFPHADDLVRYLADFAATTGLRVRHDTRAVRVTRTGGRFQLTDQHGETHQARWLIVATGPAKPYVPAIPGIELTEPYESVSVDPTDFINQRVLIIGKGASGFETADNLVETAAVIHVAGPSSIRMSWQSHDVGHLLDGKIQRIERAGDGFVVTVGLSPATEVVHELRYDRVIRCTGFQFDSSIFAGDCRPELVLDDRFPAQTSAWESTSVPDLHFAE